MAVLAAVEQIELRAHFVQLRLEPLLIVRSLLQIGPHSCCILVGTVAMVGVVVTHVLDAGRQVHMAPIGAMVMVMPVLRVAMAVTMAVIARPARDN